MISKTILLPICIVLAGFSRYTFADYGDACDTDSDCTADNANCVTIDSGCKRKGCSECKTGYILTGTTCKADIGTACTQDSDCAITTNGKCDVGVTDKCICSTGNTHSYKACVATGEKFGEDCEAGTIDDDCAVNEGDPTFGACINDLCDCAAGYIKGDGHACRKPYYDEACTATVGCQAGTMPDEQAPICDAGTTDKCICDSTDEVVTYGGSKFCNTKVAAANQKEDSLTCEAHNECKNGKCLQCPDTSGLICIGNASPTITLKPVLIIVLAFITSMLQLQRPRCDRGGRFDAYE